jgi:hypothetical protein
VSTGYIPNIDTARATAAATKCDLASDIVWRNDLKITFGDIDDVEEAVVVVLAVEILAAPPPRGKVVAAATAVVLTPLPMSGERFIGWKVWHTLVASEEDGSEEKMTRERERMV